VTGRVAAVLAPGSPPVAVVSDLFARTFFGSRDLLGQHVRFDFRGLANVGPVDFEVVGVAANARYEGLRGSIPPVVYLPYAQVPFPPLRQMTFAVRTSADPSSFVPAVHDVVRQVARGREADRGDRDPHGARRAARHGPVDGAP
jgi:hypothetical protein